MIIVLVMALRLIESTIVVKQHIGSVGDSKLASDNRLLVGILSTDIYVQSFLKVTSTAYAAQIKSLLFPRQSTGFSVQLPMQPLRESAHRVGN